MPTVVPMLAYEDGTAAMDWLIRAFGFVERERWLDDAGTLTHGELAVGADGLVMLATPTPLYEGPAHHRRALRRGRGLVGGPVRHRRRPRRGRRPRRPLRAGTRRRRADPLGARDPRSRGGFRHYRAEDLEGHRWMFSGR